jgi:hypothetical protein
MSERRSVQSWEQQLRRTAQSLPYPPTPDIAGGVVARLRREQAGRAAPWSSLSPRLRVALVVLALFALSLLAVPDVRATIGNWLRIGAVEIVFPTATPANEPAEQPIMAPTALPVTATPGASSEQPIIAPTTLPEEPTATPLASVLDLAGEMSLEQIRSRVSFPVKIPTYPEDLGPPDRAFLQEWDGPVVVLTWIEPGTRDQVRMSLHIMDFDAFARKFANDFTHVSETTVRGERAVWVTGPHMLTFYTRKAGRPTNRYVTGHVLIWEDEGITYRLEIESSLEEAVRIAESAE